MYSTLHTFTHIEFNKIHPHTQNIEVIKTHVLYSETVLLSIGTNISVFTDISEHQMVHRGITCM